MPKIVFDASSLIGALLRENSIPEQALLLARTHDILLLSTPVMAEITEVFSRPRSARYLTPGRIARILDVIAAGAQFVEPTETVADCRDAKDKKYLELAFAAQAATIISSDRDLLPLDPWRGIEIITPPKYVGRRTT